MSPFLTSNFERLLKVKTLEHVVQHCCLATLFGLLLDSLGEAFFFSVSSERRYLVGHARKALKHRSSHRCLTSPFRTMLYLHLQTCYFRREKREKKNQPESKLPPSVESIRQFRYLGAFCPGKAKHDHGLFIGRACYCFLFEILKFEKIF